jgi:ribosome maturation factor RimP
VAGKKEKMEKIIRETAESLGYECVGVEINSRPGRNTAAVYIDSIGGARHEDCELVSRAVSERLDAEDAAGENIFAGKYFLEVSSPGIERPLFTEEHYARFAGRDAAITASDGRKINGRIVSCENGVVVLKNEDGETAVPFAEIKRGRLVFTERKGEKKRGEKKQGEKKREKKK